MNFEKKLASRSGFCYTQSCRHKETTLLWPVGQGVKTPPFHGGNMGSNPIRVTIFL